MISCIALILKSWQWQGRYLESGKCMSLPFFLPYRASTKEIQTKLEAGNCTTPSQVQVLQPAVQLEKSLGEEQCGGIHHQ